MHAIANLPKITQFQGKSCGTSESSDLGANLCYADPDKKIENDLISGRPIGPNDGARLCLISVHAKRNEIGLCSHVEN